MHSVTFHAFEESRLSKAMLAPAHDALSIRGPQARQERSTTPPHGTAQHPAAQAMTSSGLDTFDLLGLDAPAQVVKPVTSAPTSTLLDVDPVAGTSTTGAMVNMGEDQASHPSSLEIESGKRYVVRCEGRWRVRSAPSLNSKVIGIIANGTIVFGEDCSGEVHPETSVQDMEGLMQQDESIEPEVLQKAS